jgi:signal transduction histidine kinase
MQRDVVAQTRLVEQLADLSSMLAGTLLLSIENVDVAPLLAELGAELQASRSSLPAVVADPKRLRQLFAILLLAQGPAMVTAECEEPLTLSIRGVIREGGAGFVGLTLARGLAEVQGGHLTISPAAEGTVFALQLPAAKG